MTTRQQLDRHARHVAKLLEERNLKIVFAESCTGGLISATLTRIPGISEFHCGSLVVYQVESKAEWLGIPRGMLEKPGPVSRVVALEMATRALKRTPHADIAASITGHLGPDAPRSQDGLLYVATAVRAARSREQRPGFQKQQQLTVKKVRLPEAQRNIPKNVLRARRQCDAAQIVFTAVISLLETMPGDESE